MKALVGKKSRNVEKRVSAEEANSAEVMLIKDIQKRAFSKEFEFMQSKGTSGKRPVIENQLNLFVDEKGVIRCRSRLENAPLLEASKAPIVLHSKTYFSELVVSQAHERVFHDGVGEALSAVRERYWILRGREIVKKFVRRCKKCARFEGKPFEFNVTPNLPEFQVSEPPPPPPPFTNTEVDFAGPLYTSGIYDSDKSVKKCYIALFTCALTRAVHLEIVESLDVDAFIRSFRRFTARRGVPFV